MLKCKKKKKKAPNTKKSASFFCYPYGTSRLQSGSCDSTREVISAALPGPPSVRCGFHRGGPRALHHLPVLLGHRLTCWDSCESPCKRVGAELRFLLSSSQAPGWELELEPDPWELWLCARWARCWTSPTHPWQRIVRHLGDWLNQLGTCGLGRVEQPVGLDEESSAWSPYQPLILRSAAGSCCLRAPCCSLLVLCTQGGRLLNVNILHFWHVACS